MRKCLIVRDLAVKWQTLRMCVHTVKACGHAAFCTEVYLEEFFLQYHAQHVPLIFM